VDRSQLAERIAAAINEAYGDYSSQFAKITRRAGDRFEHRDWHGLHEDTIERLDLYTESVDQAVTAAETLAGGVGLDHATWEAARIDCARPFDARPDREIAETFFNSVTRRIFQTEGVDAAIEFVHAAEPINGEPDLVVYERVGYLEDLLVSVLNGVGWEARWSNLRRDVRLAAAEVLRRLEIRGLNEEPDRIELIRTPFYRSQSAYLVGRIIVGDEWVPLALAVHHTSRGLSLGAALVESQDLSVLYSYTRSPFLVATTWPGALVDYLRSVMPGKRAAEMYTAIGYHKHGKTELFRDFMRHVESTEEKFVPARGIRGMVMIVFTMPGYDVVFKVIKDRFPYPKQTTRRQIMSKYRLVFRHDRAGRLIDAHEFEHLRFGKDRFDPDLLAELESAATKSVTVGDDVVLHHVYVERRVTPLDIYVREANAIKARSAIVDYGRAIKNLAASNIFPGDMLLKNFGVTSSGRVVFYDYDEIIPLIECKFREMPTTDRPEDEMSADPWFGVGDYDIFPEEFTRFLGIRGELREAFDYYHSDLFGVRFWHRIQDRVRSGEVIEVFPYKRSRRLGAWRRSLAGSIG
jgi:isocitrate dehydrogenase kinase/phosphatase